MLVEFVATEGWVGRMMLLVLSMGVFEQRAMRFKSTLGKFAKLASVSWGKCP